jgi:hypothetical protein
MSEESLRDLKRKMGKEIKIIKKDDHKSFEDYFTFIDDNNKNIELRKLGIGKEDSNLSSSPTNKKKPKEYEFKLRNDPKKDMKSRNKSRLVGSHGTQSHSPVYE